MLNINFIEKLKWINREIHKSGLSLVSKSYNAGLVYFQSHTHTTQSGLLLESQDLQHKSGLLLESQTYNTSPANSQSHRPSVYVRSTPRVDLQQFQPTLTAKDQQRRFSLLLQPKTVKLSPIEVQTCNAGLVHSQSQKSAYRSRMENTERNKSQRKEIVTVKRIYISSVYYNASSLTKYTVKFSQVLLTYKISKLCSYCLTVRINQVLK